MFYILCLNIFIFLVVAQDSIWWEIVLPSIDKKAKLRRQHYIDWRCLWGGGLEIISKGWDLVSCKVMFEVGNLIRVHF